MQHPVAPPLSPILVVGAGPTGLVAALLLARLGRPVLLAERHAAPYPLPRAVHLDDEVHRILQQLDLGNAFAAISRPALGMRLLDASHRVMAQLSRDSPIGVHGWPQANMFDQPELETLLWDEVSQQPLITVQTGTELVALQGLTATLDTATGRRDVECAAVLGCDGAASTLRGLLGIGVADLGFTERWQVVDAVCDVPLAAWPGIHQVCDPAGASTFMQVGEHRYRWEFQRPAADLPAMLAPWAPDGALTIVRTAGYTFRARLAERWRAGRVFLLGDAAHETPPFIGQGLGSGLRDAANLAWKLDRVLAGAPDALLDTYESERKPHARQLIRAAMLIGTAMTGGQDKAAAVRRGVLAAACRVPGLPSAAVSLGAPPLRAGPLVRRGRLGPLAGRHVPQPWVGGRRLDDVLGEGFAVVSTAPSPPLTTLAERLGGRAHVLPELAGWLARGRASAAVIRPDRVVLAAGSPAQLLAGAGEWLPLLGC